MGLDLPTAAQAAAIWLRQGQENPDERGKLLPLTVTVRRHYMFRCGLLKGQGGAVHTSHAKASSSA